MRSRLWIIASLLLTATPAALANTELETLRSRCLEQERQIRHLEDENSKLRSLTGEQRTTPPVPAKAAAATPAPSSPPSSSTYVVKAGDNLVKIARQVGTSSAKLAKANGIKSSSVIRPGQKLKVPGTAVAATTESPAPSAEPPSAAPKTHKVRANETYSSISRKYKISTDVLIAANPKIKPTSLREGQVINLQRQVASATQVANPPAPTPTPIPTPTPTPPVAKAPSIPVAAPPATAPMPQPAAPTAPQAVAEIPAQTPSVEKKIRPIVIEQEMTYGEFATKHGTNPERLNALNGLDLTSATVLAKGSELYVPGN